jgi:predicted GTPase
VVGARSAVVQRSLEDLDRVVGLATEADRPDLVERLRRARAERVADDSAVAVVGEFKQGKSTLINALLRTVVCPADADIVTSVPMTVRYGVPAAVTARLMPTTDPTSADPPSVDVAFGRLREYVTRPPGDVTAVQAFDVRLDRRLLRDGLTLVDTPGVGGLDSAQGNMTLGTIATARAALFVTDAAQELTAPELYFLRRAVERCPTVVCVVTKIDLHD